MYNSTPCEVVFVGSRGYALQYNRNEVCHTRGLGLVLRSFIKPDQIYDLKDVKSENFYSVARNFTEKYQILMHQEQHQTFLLVAYDKNMLKDDNHGSYYNSNKFVRDEDTGKMKEKEL